MYVASYTRGTSRTSSILTFVSVKYFFKQIFHNKNTLKVQNKKDMYKCKQESTATLIAL